MDVRLLIFALFGHVTYVVSQVVCTPPLPGVSTLAYIQDPNNSCRLYVCVGTLNSGKFQCPSDRSLLTNIRAQFPNLCRSCTTAGSQMTSTIGSTSTMPRSFMANTHKLGGAQQAGLVTVNACLTGCSANGNCLAADFDNRDNSCWFHTASTACTRAVSKPFCTHYSFTNCGSSFGTTPLGNSPPPPTSASPPVERPLAVDTEDGFHIVGGSLHTGMSSDYECLRACRADPTCQGADFNRVTDNCWFHTSATVCGALVRKANCVHYKLTTCPAPPVINDDIVPLDELLDRIITTNVNSYKSGGTRQATNLDTVYKCIGGCQRDAGCSGVDFDRSNRLCYFHTAAIECDDVASPLLPRQGTDHYRLSLCIVN